MKVVSSASHMDDVLQDGQVLTLDQDPEGLEITSSTGWGVYPLDSVFVRPEQRTIGEVVRRIRANRYDLNPEFQRDFLWRTDKQSRLIESCLMRIPLPVFYVAQASDGRIIVVDGLQRLTTFKRFLGNEFSLELPSSDDSTSTSNSLSGKFFKDLPLNLQERIEDTPLILYVLDEKAPARAKLDIFERVNGGVPLTRQQMRNCLYNGSATRWLKEAAESKVFQKVIGGGLDRQKMRDREVINRFCAFRLMGPDAYRSSDMDGFLADALEKMNSARQDELTRLRSEFDRSMGNNYLLFGHHAFRKSLRFPQGSRSVLNVALFDVCATLLADFETSQVTARARELWKAIRNLIDDAAFSEAITNSTNSTRRVRTRFEMMNEAIHKATL